MSKPKKSRTGLDPLTREQDRLSKILSLQRQNDIIAMILEGKEAKEIRKYLINKYRLTDGSASVYISSARKEIEKRKNFEVDNLITMHIARYEYIYTKLYEMRSFINAANCLRSKEKLLGFHKEGFHMKVSQGEITALHLQQVQDEFDVMKLPEEKRNRMSFLLDKAKRDYDRSKKELE